MKYYIIIAAMATLLFSTEPACADSWTLPTERTYLSENDCSRLTVTPRNIEDQLSYFRDSIEGRQLNGIGPRGRLETRDPSGRWSIAWEADFVNRVAPVNAIVTDSGDFVVTFNNWHSVGYGDDVVVIYGDGGELVRSFALADFLSEDYQTALPRSVSSMWWGGAHQFSVDQAQLILKIVVPADENLQNEPQYIDLFINLADGSIVIPRRADWQEAERIATEIANQRTQAGREREDAFRRPLIGPADGAMPAWHSYLREAFDRLDPDWPNSVGWTTIFFPEAHERFERSVGWARERLSEELFPGAAFIFGSPSQEALTRAMLQLAGEQASGSLNGYRVYVAANDQHSPSIEAALEHTGADYIQVDPAQPISQRPERMTAEGRARIFDQMTQDLMRELETVADDFANDQ